MKDIKNIKYYTLPIGRFPIDVVNKVDNDNTLYGMYFGQDNHIVIRHGLSHNIKAQTLLHEILHAIFVSEDIKHKDETISRLTSGLLYFIRNNEDILDFIKTEKLERK